MTGQMCRSGLQNSVLEISHRMMLHGRVDQMKLTAIKSRHELRTVMLYHVGDSQHTQNIQVNKVISEHEKCVFYFREKSHIDFLANPIEIERTNKNILPQDENLEPALKIQNGVAKIIVS